MGRQPEQPIKIGVKDDLELDGLLCLQQERARCCPVIVCHPHPAHGGSMHNNVIAAVTDELIGRGMTTLRFNYRTTGAPQATEGYRGEVEDLLAAIGYLGKCLGRKDVPVRLVGYSFGSYIVLEVAALCADVKAAAAIAPPVSSMAMDGLGRFEKPKYFIHALRDSYATLEDFGGWYEKLPQPKEVCPIETDHFFAGVESLVAKEVADRLLG